MTLPLPSKPGLDGSKVLSIPSTWSMAWFRDFINNILKGADVRNSIGGPGISVSGNIASPFATIGLNAPQTGTATANFTATNKPGANASVVGWIPVNVGGVTRYLPLFG